MATRWNLRALQDLMDQVGFASFALRDLQRYWPPDDPAVRDASAATFPWPFDPQKVQEKLDQWRYGVLEELRGRRLTPKDWMPSRLESARGPEVGAVPKLPHASRAKLNDRTRSFVELARITAERMAEARGHWNMLNQTEDAAVTRNYPFDPPFGFLVRDALEWFDAVYGAAHRRRR